MENMNNSILPRNKSGINSVLEKFNESTTVNPISGKLVCPMCGTTVESEDGYSYVCPSCDFAFDVPSINTPEETVEDTTVPEEPVDVGAVIEAVCDSGDFNDRSLLEGYDNIVTDGTYALLEKTKIVIQDGKKVKKTIRTKKKRLTAKQKAALRKARKKANTSAAKKARKKSMKLRKRMGLDESVMMDRAFKAAKAYCESVGVTASIPALRAQLHSMVEGVTQSEITDAVSRAFHKITGVTVDYVDVVSFDAGVAAVEVGLTSSDDIDVDIEQVIADIQSDISVDVEDFDYEEDDEDENSVVVELYIAAAMDEAEEVPPPVKTNPDEKAEEACGTKKKKVNEEEEPEEEPVQESYSNYLAVGGKGNVRCTINPRFIQKGQVICDTDTNTIFTAMTEAQDYGKDQVRLAVKVHSSDDAAMCESVAGAEVALSTSGTYLLLRKNPLAM